MSARVTSVSLSLVLVYLYRSSKFLLTTQTCMQACHHTHTNIAEDIFCLTDYQGQISSMLKDMDCRPCGDTSCEASLFALSRRRPRGPGPDTAAVPPPRRRSLDHGWEPWCELPVLVHLPLPAPVPVLHPPELQDSTHFLHLLECYCCCSSSSSSCCSFSSSPPPPLPPHHPGVFFLGHLHDLGRHSCRMSVQQALPPPAPPPAPGTLRTESALSLRHQSW